MDSIIAAACAKPPGTELALKLLNAHPTVTLDSATIQPLLADDNEKLRALVLAEANEGSEYVCLSLVDALCARSPAFLAALTAPAMLASLCAQLLAPWLRDKPAALEDLRREKVVEVSSMHNGSSKPPETA